MIEIRKNRVLGRRVFEPTPKDIRRACEEIQATWSPRERAKRDRLSFPDTVPQIPVASIGYSMALSVIAHTAMALFDHPIMIRSPLASSVTAKYPIVLSVNRTASSTMALTGTNW
jgi:hypothetical protein